MAPSNMRYNRVTKYKSHRYFYIDVPVLNMTILTMVLVYIVYTNI